ncbi:MAG: hypothetical protein ERJ68_00090 [Aphanocapsa feldmannii 277cI]|uniref:Uncharacterized protein n=1 Tax=Aphanocapsa feldmannii 277cI TaxID=2507554 RepID=A0A524RVY7_9CHRO|nr:MAG: hypothetical protein ERJ68_00090 [Aphanocapsa feldmannii 277cI]
MIDTPIDLLALPAPELIEPLDYEQILRELIEDFRRRNPDYSQILESDPVVKVLEVAASREVILRGRVNDAYRGTLLAFAAGADLDHLAAFYGVRRMTEESDARLRQRTTLRSQGSSTAGGASWYRYHALSVSTEIVDAAISSPSPGLVQMHLLGRRPSGIPTVLLQRVRKHLNGDAVRVVSDLLQIDEAERVPIVVVARLRLVSDSLLTTTALREALQDAFDGQRALGRGISRSWISAQLHLPGVVSVELSYPPTDVVVGPDQVAQLLSVHLRLH